MRGPNSLKRIRRRRTIASISYNRGDRYDCMVYRHQMLQTRNHMICKNSFSTLDENFHTSISFGDKSIVNVMGKWNIYLKARNRFLEIISNVFYTSNLKANLFSVG